jgi:hypothetical protein
MTLLHTVTPSSGLYVPAAVVADRERHARVMPDGMFRASREPDPSWQVALNDIMPPSDDLPTLAVRWEAGTPDDPIQRWVVWELWPIGWAHPDFIHALTHEDPTAPHALCAPSQHALYRATGRYANPFFLVQGGGGGTRYRWSPEESSLMRTLGLPMEPPAAGELPYAEPDGRTWAAIRELNRLAKANGDLAKVKTMNAAERAELEKRQRTAVVAQMCNELDYELARDITQAWSALASDVPEETAHHAKAHLWEDVRDEYIETGRM